MTSAPDPALAISYIGILFACLWRGRLRWIGLPLAAAVALWPRPAPPAAWIASDGNDAAVAVAGQTVALNPGKRLYATQLWSQAQGLTLPADPAAAQARLFDCDRWGCAPIGNVRPALAAWWTIRKPPKPERLSRALPRRRDPDHARRVDRAGRLPRAAGARARRLRGAAARPTSIRQPHGWRLVWAQPIRGRRPWTTPSDSDE